MAAITVIAPTVIVTKRNEMCEVYHVSVQNVTVVLHHYSVFVVIQLTRSSSLSSGIQIAYRCDVLVGLGGTLTHHVDMCEG